MLPAALEIPAVREERLEHKIANLDRACRALERSVATPVMEPRDLSGIIKDFELAYEIAWRALRARLEHDGHPVTTARAAFARAYQLDLLDDEATWLEMIEDRNRSVHVYNEDDARTLAERVAAHHLRALRALLTRLREP